MSLFFSNQETKKVCQWHGEKLYNVTDKRYFSLAELEEMYHFTINGHYTDLTKHNKYMLWHFVGF